ncbi:MAG: amidohydrolase [Deltaproteobacteria bacterium]|nr:amidohydrolase [Deltaproteobacteria bacterium]
MAGSFSRASGHKLEPADLVILNGKILTEDVKQPEAEALAIRKDTIVAVGSNNDVRAYIGKSTQTMDISGMLAVPGFIEGHGHLLLLGQSKMELDLTAARNWDEIVSIVRNSVLKAGPGAWILGSGWHQEKWNKIPSPAIEGYPMDGTLNKASPDNPVLLTHASGHALFANARARKLAGITKTTVAPEGGRILRDSRGNPTGVFFDVAQDLIGKAHKDNLARRTPAQIEAQSREAVRLAVRDCLSKGITSFQDASSSFRDIDLYRKLVAENDLKIRLWAMIHESKKELAENLTNYRIDNLGDKRLTVRAIKKFMDGALGSHTAWLLTPYSDLPGSTGLNVESTEDILETARLAIKTGFQLCVHAIGDRANRETLNIYETVFKENPNSGNLRWRIEHAQHLNPLDIPRFGQLGVIASMQAVHCTSDGPWVPKRLGTQRAEEGAYVWQKLMRTGAVVTNGTDTPVEDVDPIANFHAAVTRKLPDGSTFYPDQRMSREEALRSYTINNAYAAFEEDIKGSLTPGKLADITILSKDIMKVPEDEIRTTRVIYTIVGGKIQFGDVHK